MAWANWFRSADSDRRAASLIGLDLNSSRARAVAFRAQRARTVLLDDPHAELPLSISLEQRSAEVGHAGLNICRRSPHLVCDNFLPLLGQPQEWRANRHRLDARAALGLTLDKLRNALGEMEFGAVALPVYLSISQVTRLLQQSEKAKLGLKGAVVMPLALAGGLADQVLSGDGGISFLLPEEADEEPADLGKTWVDTGDSEADSETGILPLPKIRRDTPPGPVAEDGPILATGVVIDVDDFALSASVIGFEETQARILAASTQPRLSLRIWKERLLDCLADRCIRVCRRDPRDSASAEQALFDQLEDALERTRHGQKVSLHVRAGHWFQDLVQRPDDFDGYCAGLIRQTIESVRDLLDTTDRREPPRALWLTHAAGRLPGLANALHHHMSERTLVSVLHPDAVAQATAILANRWLSGELPRVYLDTSLPLWGHSMRQANANPDHQPDPPRQARDR